MKNGTDTRSKGVPTSERAKSRAAAGPVDMAQKAQIRFAQSFTSIVSVLMRDANFRKLRLSDLETFVLPAIMTGQWRMAHARVASPDASGENKQDRVIPAGVAVWARVSEAVDKRLTEDLDKPLTLRPEEWTSGEIIWLLAVAGDPRVIPKFMKQLDATVFEGKLVKMRQRGADGRAVVTGSVRTKDAAAPTAA